MTEARQETHREADLRRIVQRAILLVEAYLDPDHAVYEIAKTKLSMRKNDGSPLTAEDVVWGVAIILSELNDALGGNCSVTGPQEMPQLLNGWS